VLDELKAFISEQSGLSWKCVVESPILGPAGNKEFLVLIEKTN
jgi:predicted rRNA methylase YqxC with S4 and FtsJ domains